MEAQQLTPQVSVTRSLSPNLAFIIYVMNFNILVIHLMGIIIITHQKLMLYHIRSSYFPYFDILFIFHLCLHEAQ